MEPSHSFADYYTPCYDPRKSHFVVNDLGNSLVSCYDERCGILLGDHKLPDSCVVLCKEYIKEAYAIDLYHALDDYSDLQQRPVAYGNLQRRLNGMVGDVGIEGYKYSGATVPCLPWSGPSVDSMSETDQACLAHIRYIAEAMTQDFFLKGNLFRSESNNPGRVNTCLINYYRDGNDTIGKHSDNVAQMGVPLVVLQGPLGPVPVVPPPSYSGDFVAILTLTEGKGIGVRNMVIEDKATGERISVSPDCGDLLLMLGKTQKYKTHEIPKDSRCHRGRKSLTYRAFST